MLYVLCCNAIAKSEASNTKKHCISAVIQFLLLLLLKVACLAKSEASNTKKHCLSADNQFVAIIVKSRVRVAFVLAIAVKAIKQCAG